MKDHDWVSKSGRPWSLRVKSDLCAKCGSTPDTHPEQEDASMTYDAERDREIFEAEVEDWYTAYDSLGAAEARTFEGRRGLYDDFQRAYYDARNSRGSNPLQPDVAWRGTEEYEQLREDGRPDYAVHPGESLAELIEERGWSQKHVADRCYVSEKHVSQVVSGKAGIGPRFAVALERLTGVTAEFWMRLQVNHDVAEARKVPPGPAAPPPPPKDREYA